MSETAFVQHQVHAEQFALVHNRLTTALQGRMLFRGQLPAISQLMYAHLLLVMHGGKEDDWRPSVAVLHVGLARLDSSSSTIPYEIPDSGLAKLVDDCLVDQNVHSAVAKVEVALAIAGMLRLDMQASGERVGAMRRGQKCSEEWSETLGPNSLLIKELRQQLDVAHAYYRND